MDRHQAQERLVRTGRQVDTVDDANVARVSRRGANAAPIPTMDTDNSEAEQAANELINRIRQGMRVVDVNGEQLGNVEAVKMGDPEAATVGADVPAAPGLIAAFFGDGGPDIPEPLRSRLLRVGYVKVDGKGWIDTDRFITADLVGTVSGDTVSLTVDKERLLQAW